MVRSPEGSRWKCKHFLETVVDTAVVAIFILLIEKRSPQTQLVQSYLSTSHMRQLRQNPTHHTEERILEAMKRKETAIEVHKDGEVVADSLQDLAVTHADLERLLGDSQGET